MFFEKYMRKKPKSNKVIKITKKSGNSKKSYYAVAIGIIIFFTISIYLLKSGTEAEENSSPIKQEEILLSKNEERIKDNDLLKETAADEVKEKDTKENLLLVKKKRIELFLQGKETHFKISNTNGITMVINGVSIKPNMPIKDNIRYIVSGVKRNGDRIEDSQIEIEFYEKEYLIKKLQLSFNESYKIHYFLDGVSLETLNNTSPITDIVFVDESIKKDFVFNTYKEDANKAYFGLNFHGVQFVSEINLSDVE